MTGASGGAATATYGTGQAQAPGNLLVCRCDGFGVATFPTTPAGWFMAVQKAGQACSATIFYKVAVGSDLAPIIAAVASNTWQVDVNEFSGIRHSSPLDQVGSVQGISPTPLVATAGGVDVPLGELVIAAAACRTAATNTLATALALNNGAIATSVNNNGTSTTLHYNFVYGVTTGNSVADTASLTGLSGSANAVIIASFKLLVPTRTLMGAGP